MTKTNRNLIVAILAVILTFSIALAGIYGIRQARADETLPNVENQETFELKVGDTILGKTLVFNPGPEISGSMVTLSNGATLINDFGIVVYNKDDIGARIYTAERDNLENTYIDITESITFINYEEEEVVVTFTEDLTVVEINGPTVLYFITPVEEPEETPDESEQEPEDTPTEVPGDDNVGQTPEEPTEKPTDDNNVDKGDKDNKQDKNDVTEDTFDFEDAIDWAMDNVALVICISIIVILFVALILKNKRG